MKLKFSKWVLWDNRDQLGDDLKNPGIYSLAISNKDLSGEKFTYRKEIHYFGMSNSKLGIKGRLKQFDDSLRSKSKGHGGAERFMGEHKDGNKLAKKLYVSICTFSCNVKTPSPDDYRIMGSVAMAEYEAFAMYLEKFQELPRYNNKASPKRKFP